MNKNIFERLIKGTTANTLAFLTNFAYSILLIPFFLGYWGAEKYGIWLTLYATYSLLKTFDSGHSQYIGNEFNKYLHINKIKAWKILGSGIRVAVSIAIIELFVWIFLIATNHTTILTKNLDNYIQEINYGVLGLLIMWVAIGSVGGIVVRILPPLGRYDISAYSAVLNKLLEIGILLSAIILNLSIYHTALILAIALFFYSLSILLYIKSKFPEFFPWWKYGNINIGLKNFKQSLVLTANGFINQFSTNGLILVISSMLSPAVIPIFTTIKTIANIATQATSLFLNPLLPEIIRYHSTSQFDKIIEIVKTNWVITGLILNIPFLFSLFFIENLYIIWTNNSMVFNYNLYMTLSLSVLFLNYGNTYTSYLGGINHLRALFWITFSRGLLLLFLSIGLLPYFGLTALGWSFLITEIIVSVFLPAYYFKKAIHKKDPKIKITGKKLALYSITTVSIYYCYYNYFEKNNLLFALILGIINVIIALLQWKDLSSILKLKFINLIPFHSK